MLKIKYFALCAVLLLSSCAQYKNTQGTRKLGRELQGSWTLSSVTYSRAGKYDVILFNDTSSDCFISSQWNFVFNNYRGSYDITSENCSKGKRHFIFVLDEVDKTAGYYDMLIKPTDEHYKSATNAGVRLHIDKVSADEMTLEQALILKDRKSFIIKMNFKRSE